MLAFLTAVSLLSLPNPAPVDAAAAACLTGRVLDGAARPLARAAVTLLARGAGGGLHTAQSGEGGRFDLSDVAPGVYWLVIDRAGFEREIRPLEFGSGGTWSGDVELRPMAAFLRTSSGRDQAPWLLRGISSDPLRLSPEGELDSSWLDDSPTRVVQGRVGWEALAGDGDSGAMLGQRTSVELAGRVAERLAWFVDGSMDDLQFRGDEGSDSVDRDRIEYGLDFGKEGGLLFRAELQQLTRGGDVDLPASMERQASYRLGYRSSAETADVDVSLRYRAAISDGQSGDGGADSERHSIWEGRGELAHQIASGHLLRSIFALRAQQLSSPDTAVLVDALTGPGQFHEGRFSPSTWQLFVREAYEWELASSLMVLASVDFGHFSGVQPSGLLRPRMAARLNLDPRSTVEVETSWLIRELYRDAPVALDAELEVAGRLGLLVAYERGFGDASLRVSALRNSLEELDGLAAKSAGRDQYLVLALGSVASQEFRVDLRTAGGAGFRGHVGAAFGTAQGELGLLPPSTRLAVAQLSPAFYTKLRYGSATVGGEVERTQTGVVVSYRWLRSGDLEVRRLEHIDVQLAQALPWRAIGGAQLDLQLALRGYLRRPTVSDPVVPISVEHLLSSPMVAAGVGVRF